MPTLLRENGSRFYFYRNENNEPIHIHITKGSAREKICLEPDLKVKQYRGRNKLCRIISRNLKVNGMSISNTNEFDAIEQLVFRRVCELKHLIFARKLIC